MATNKQFTQNFLSSMPAWAKGTMGVVVIGGIAFGGYKLYKYIQKQKELEGAKAETKATQETIDKLKKKGLKPTLDSLQLKQIANQLHTSMNGYGTSFSNVAKAFTYPKNDLDIVGLNQAYGIRKLSSGKLNFADDFEGTLPQSLTEELDRKELTAINNMLAKKGIGYRY